MNTDAVSLADRARSAFRTFWALPAFVVVSLIPWLLALYAFVRSREFYEAGRHSLGLGFKIGAIVIAVITAFSTLWFVVIWLWMLTRCVRGLETHRRGTEA